MKTSSRRNSVLERRLRELEEESKHIRSKYKLLNKSMKRAGSGSEKLNQAPHRPTAVQRPGGSLYSNENSPLRDNAMHPGQGGLPGIDNGCGGDNATGSRNPVHSDERFAHYFATGGFKPLTPISQGRAIQRNKAIFMVVIVVFLGYVIYYALIR